MFVMVKPRCAFLSVFVCRTEETTILEGRVSKTGAIIQGGGGLLRATVKAFSSLL